MGVGPRGHQTVGADFAGAGGRADMHQAPDTQRFAGQHQGHAHQPGQRAWAGAKEHSERQGHRQFVAPLEKETTEAVF